MKMEKLTLKTTNMKKTTLITIKVVFCLKMLII
jgi:hypothetical protein